MSKKSVIIIGAGLAGLSAGCFCQINGYESQIFEHHTLPGGVAATWKRKGYTIDGGIHFLMGHKPGTGLHELYSQLGAVSEDTFVDMNSYARFIDEKRGYKLDITGNLEKLGQKLKDLSPEDGKIIDDLIKGARALQGLDMSETGLAKPPELTGPLDQIKDMWSMGKLLPYFTGKYSKSVKDYVKTVKNPLLQEIIKNLFTPEVPVWFIFMLLGLLADGQLGLLKKGCLDFALSIEKRYKELGGKITYKSTVEEIIVENNKAAGVRLAGGTEHRAHVIVSAADGYSTIFKMLGGKYINTEIRKRYDNRELCTPFITVSFGVKREFPGEPVYTTFLLKEPFTAGGMEISGMSLRLFNYSPDFAPSRKSVVQTIIEGKWDYWNELQEKDRKAYEAEKERVAEEILKRLEIHYPGISKEVEVTDVATPYTTWRYTLNQRGSWGGWLYTPETIIKQIERTLPGLDNFYMAGHWVLMGVSGVLYSGRHVAQLMCHKDRKKFISKKRDL